MPPRTTRPAPEPSALFNLIHAVIVVIAAVVLGLALRTTLPAASLSLVFVCAVLLVAARSGKAVAAGAAIASSIVYNYFFTEPRLTLRIHSPAEIATVVTLFVTALAVGHLAGRLRTQVSSLELAHRHARALQGLGERLGNAAREEDALAAGCDILATALECECAALRAADGNDGPWRVVAAHPDGAEPDRSAFAAADVAARRLRPAGRHEGEDGAWWLLPMAVEERCLGVLAMRPADAAAELAPEQRRLAHSVAQQVAHAVDRVRLVARLEEARIDSESEKLRSALLSSVSHDLRSPLSAVIGAATSLAAYGDRLSDADRLELLDSIRSESERLDRYIQNLLDMTRLGTGPLRLRRDWSGLDEIVASAVARLVRAHPATPVRVELAPGLPPLHVHAALVEQALFNVLDNAAKFSPRGSEVVLSAHRNGEQLELEVADRGPGIPSEERTRIFDLAYRVRRGDRPMHGSGLGLHIVRGMVGAHGGRVEALSGEAGVGTVLRITLPLTEPPVLPAEESA